MVTTALQPGELRHAWSTGELALMEQFNNLLIAALLHNYALSQATVSGKTFYKAYADLDLCVIIH